MEDIVDVLLTLFAVVAITFLLCIAAAVWTLKALVRRVRTAMSAARRAPAPVLRLQALRPGPARAVAVARRDLRANMDSAERTLALGLAAGRPVHGLLPVSRQLAQAARELDLDLAVIAAEPDGQVRAALLAREQVRLTTLQHACAELRRGVQVAGGVSATPRLDGAMADLGEEMTRLALWAQAHQQLSKRLRF